MVNTRCRLSVRTRTHAESGYSEYGAPQTTPELLTRTSSSRTVSSITAGTEGGGGRRLKPIRRGSQIGNEDRVGGGWGSLNSFPAWKVPLLISCSPPACKSPLGLNVPCLSQAYSILRTLFRTPLHLCWICTPLRRSPRSPVISCDRYL